VAYSSSWQEQLPYSLSCQRLLTLDKTLRDFKAKVCIVIVPNRTAV
jgi:hypothetical protein